MVNLNEDRLYSLLSKVKGRCELITSVKSLSALENYINGYIDACLTFDSNSATICWYNAFLTYTAAVCGIAQDHISLATAITSCGYDDVTGVDFFVELLEKFAQEHHQAEPEQTHTGEIRTFCIDQYKATDFIGKYLQEHSEEYFGLPDTKTIKSYVLTWLENGRLICVLCDSTVAPTILSTKNKWLFEKAKELPTFSTGDRVMYSKLWLQEAK